MDKEKQEIYDKSLNWIYYLNRPFDLFGCSIWHLWYREYSKRLSNLDKHDSLFIEESENLVRSYRIKEQMAEFKKAISELVSKNPKKCKALLEEGIKLNKESDQIFEKGLGSFQDFESSLRYITEVAIHCVIFPHFVLLELNEKTTENKDLWEMSEKIRSKSIYPIILNKIVKPMAQKTLESKGLKIDPEKIELLNITEILTNSTKELEQRIKARNDGKNFVYQIIDEKETINWVDETKKIIEKLEKTKVDIEVTEIKGQIAYKGKAKGIARIITTIDGKGATFNKGDILVTLNSNPHLMPLIKKSAAIVSDMGGVGCHAAIISRELKIPCIIGTKIATKVFKDGDLVEVDAVSGVIKKIK